MIWAMTTGVVANLLEQPTYLMPEVDSLLGLPKGTARRWIDGYERSGRSYPPVVRPSPTASDVVTWGEFVEARFLAEYRRGGALMLNMHRAVERLREELNTLYPLAHAHPFLDVQGRELVRRVQEQAHVESAYEIVVVRNDQAVLTPESEGFVGSAEFGGEDRFVQRLSPAPDLRLVVFDPLRRSGAPVVRDRGVPTSVIAEQVRAGEGIDGIADSYELSRDQVEAALRYELVVAGPTRAA
jgi:uncharacterized protein (DUF433 family)